ncbi:hypothetical protein G6F56_013762 [Rhizopus delemar]|nr:hypothetical protein G6F56_013762 [Rhizopus delemar]
MHAPDLRLAVRRDAVQRQLVGRRVAQHGHPRRQAVLAHRTQEAGAAAPFLHPRQAQRSHQVGLGHVLAAGGGALVTGQATVLLSRCTTAPAGTRTPCGVLAACGCACSRKLTRTPISGTMRGSFTFSATRTFTVALPRSAVGMMAITSPGIFHSG